MNILRTRLSAAAAIGAMLILFSGYGLASEKSLKMKDLPKAVQKTVQEQTAGATLRGLSKETEKGKTFYEAETTVNGRTRDLLIDSKGVVVEVEEEVAMDSIPAVVKTEIQSHSDKVIKVETVTKGGTLAFYEAQVQKNGKKSEIQVSPEGKLITRPK